MTHRSKECALWCYSNNKASCFELDKGGREGREGERPRNLWLVTLLCLCLAPASPQIYAWIRTLSSSLVFPELDPSVK